MSEKVGPLSFDTPQPGELTLDKPYSESTAQLIDQEVRDLVGAALDKTRQLLRDKRDSIEKVSDNGVAQFNHCPVLALIVRFFLKRFLIF